jgi:SWI/SNF-related matrix-associated actin-dependent regulator of chromatin subfamily A3
MGLGKTLTCVALIASTLDSATSFAATPRTPIEPPPPRVDDESPLSASNFAGSVWGVSFGPESNNVPGPTSAKGKAKAIRLHDKLEAEYVRACRIKAKSRATLIICPLSTVANWEDQFREHWRGEVSVFGGAGACTPATGTPTPQPAASCSSSQVNPCSSSRIDSKPDANSFRIREGKPLRVYVYHGNARRPDPAFLADFDAVITTYATLATEFSKQSRSIANAEAEEDDGEGSSDPGSFDHDERMVVTPQPKRPPFKRKKPTLGALGTEAASALQSVHWFRVVLDEAQCVLFISPTS